MISCGLLGMALLVMINLRYSLMNDTSVSVDKCLEGLIHTEELITPNESQRYGHLLCDPSNGAFLELFRQDRNRLRRMERSLFLKDLRSYRLSGLVCNDNLDPDLPPVATEPAFKCLTLDYRKKACMDGRASFPHSCSAFRHNEHTARDTLRVEGPYTSTDASNHRISNCDHPASECDSYLVGDGAPIVPGQLSAGLAEAKIFRVRSDGRPLWTTEVLNHLLGMIQADKDISPIHYPGSHAALDRALRRVGVKDQRVLVIGSISPWVEAIALSLGAASPTVTVDYNQPKSSDRRLEVQYMNDMLLDLSTWPLIVSYSSIEHDGQGRYDDPLDPDGDLAAMKEMWLKLAPGGYFLLGVPFFMNDEFHWYSQRSYGPARLPLLTKGWEYMGLTTSKQDYGAENEFNIVDVHDYSPVLILRKPSHTKVSLRANDDGFPTWLDVLDTAVDGLNCNPDGTCRKNVT